MSNFLTVVLRMPENLESRQEVAQCFRLGEKFKGATVTSASMEDEITVNELLEQAMAEHNLDDVAEQVRNEVRAQRQ